MEDAQSKLPRSGKRRKKGKLEIEYQRTNTKRMMYATFKKEDYFIGDTYDGYWEHRHRKAILDMAA